MSLLIPASAHESRRGTALISHRWAPAHVAMGSSVNGQANEWAGFRALSTPWPRSKTISGCPLNTPPLRLGALKRAHLVNWHDLPMSYISTVLLQHVATRCRGRNPPDVTVRSCFCESWLLSVRIDLGRPGSVRCMVAAVHTCVRTVNSQHSAYPRTRGLCPRCPPVPVP